MRYLGTISVPTGSVKNNDSTAAPFVIPDEACLLYLVPSAAVAFETASEKTYTTDATKGYPLDPAANGPNPITVTGLVKSRGQKFLSVRNDSGGTATLKVWRS